MNAPESRNLAGRYELEVLLGRGGSGAVWRGRDLVTGREIAVKFVELGGADDVSELAETIGRFRREARLVAGLRHPNMVAALDAGRVGSELYLVMELAHGISLAQMTSERRSRGMGLLPVASVLRIADQVCIGLATAHAAGVVHRDIKPGNIMVTAQLGVKIVDFGIARLLNDNAPRLTRRGYTVGTPAYMSPEQARDEDVDGRTDVYSLGCVLYELLSGEPPFQAATTEQLLMLQLDGRATPLREVRPDIPARLADLVADMMRKDQEARPQAGEVIRRLRDISAVVVSGAPAHEADRQTARPGNSRGAPTGPSAVIREPTRDATREPTHDAFAPDRAPLPAPAPGRPARPWATEAASPWARAEAAAPDSWVSPSLAAGQTAGALGPSAASPSAPSPSAARPAPAWPEGPRRPPRSRRSRWRRALSSLLTVAIVAGVGIYLWARDQGHLQVTSVQAGPVTQTVGCGGTAVIPGVIFTNGHGGPVSYEWVYSKGAGSGPLVAEDASGSGTVSVSADWHLVGQGSGQVQAKLIVLSPGQAESSFSFSYSCTS